MPFKGDFSPLQLVFSKMRTQLLLLSFQELQVHRANISQHRVSWKIAIPFLILSLSDAKKASLLAAYLISI